MLALIVFAGYEVFPARRDAMTIPDPQKLGTYNQIDRSRQYTRADGPELLRSLNEAWSRIRGCQQELAKKDLAIADLRNKLNRSQVANVVLTSIVTALAVKGLEFLIQTWR